MRKTIAALMGAVSLAVSGLFPAAAETKVAFLMRDDTASKSAGMTDQQMQDLAALLWAYGVEVIDVSRLKVDRIKEARDEFESKLGGADVAMLYYVGVATTGGAKSFVLVGADAAQQAGKARIDVVPLLERMRGTSQRSLAIFDVLKQRRQRGQTATEERPGFSGISAIPVGSESQLVAYTNTFADSAGSQGLPLSRALMRHLQTEQAGRGVKLQQLASLVRQDVAFETGGLYVPWVVGGLPESIELKPMPELEVRQMRVKALTSLMRAKQCVSANGQDESLRQAVANFLGAAAGAGPRDQILNRLAAKDFEEMYYRLRSATSGCPFNFRPTPVAVPREAPASAPRQTVARQQPREVDNTPRRQVSNGGGGGNGGNGGGGARGAISVAPAPF